MSTLEARIRATFEELANGDQPPARISVGAASERGRRRLRWRRARLAGTPVLAALAVLAISVAADVTGAQPSATGHHHRAAPHAAPLTAAPARFSPLRTFASFSWLPPGERFASGGGSELTYGADIDAGRQVIWQLQAFAAGVCVPNRAATQVVCQPGGGISQSFALAGRAASVGGHRAYWVNSGPQPGDQHQQVLWQYATSGWAELGTGSSSHGSPSTLLRIAAGVSFGGSGQLVRFAVQLTKVPRSWQVASDFYGATSGKLLDNRATFTADGQDGSRLPFLTVERAARSCSNVYPPGRSRNAVINGYHVVVSTVPAARGAPPSYQVCAPDVHGLWVFISVNSERPAVMPLTLFRNLRVLGTDPANWVTAPTGR